MTRTTLLGLAVLALLGACREQAAGEAAAAVAIDNQAKPAAPQRPPLRFALSPREAAIASWLDETFPLQRDYSALYRRSIRDRTAEFNACKSDACRQEVAAQRNAAVAFAEGRPARVAGLGLASGRFTRDEQGFSGLARIIPVNADKAMLAIALSFKQRPSCELAAVMTRSGAGAWNVAPFDSEGDPLTLMADGANGFTLRYVDPEHQPYNDSYCSVGVGIDGRYMRAG